MASKIVTLECISNLHVGNGEANYNIIDNEVARDAVTNYPTINASGVKGALREFFCATGVENAVIDAVFGADVNKSSTAGKVKFFNADMLAIAVRASKGPAPYYLVTTQPALDKLSDNFKIFCGTSLESTKGKCEQCAAEGINLSETKQVLGKTLYVVSDKDFRKLSLPVVARNQLEDGTSKNLWYEEFVPHESIFTFVAHCNAQDDACLTAFTAAVDGKVVQFGGNASVGGGYCKVSVKG